MILCECGKFVDGCTFKDYLKTTANPSTSTIGHSECGFIFNFIDAQLPKRYSSKIELKSIGMEFAKRVNISHEEIGPFLLELDRIKSKGNLSDIEILKIAYRNYVMKRSRY